MIFRTLVALRIFSLSSLKINNWAASADKYELNGSRVIDVPSSVSWVEYLAPIFSLYSEAWSVNLSKFSVPNTLFSSLP